MESDPNARLINRAGAWVATAALIVIFASRPALAQLTLTKNSAADWQISNGAITLDWDSNQGNVWSVVLAGHTDNLVDTEQFSGDGTYKGLYMDNSGPGSGTVTNGYVLSQGNYLDWWITTASNSSNAFTFTQHFIVFPNDPGIHVYVVFAHSSTDIAGSLGQVQYVFRISQPLFTNTYSYNSGLNNLGPTLIPLPDTTIINNTDPGRQVQNAVVDIHGLSPIPSGFTRGFYTKYDYSSFEYLHEVHGVYGSTYGCWGVFPRTDSMVGGPVKQDLIFTGNICMGELLSDHLAYNVGYTPPQGVNSSRLFGPVYFRFNTGTPAAMFNDALNSMSAALANWDTDSTLIAAGYVPSSGRGSVSASVSGGGSNSGGSAWTVLADNGSDFQFTNVGSQYWDENDSNGNAQMTGVVPGTYRLSSYVLGQWGESRLNNVSVSAGKATNVSIPFTQENFSTFAPIWTIGTPTRSADKFLHGTNGTTGQDDREYPGAWNYWQDFQGNNGTVVYYATAVGSTPATNNLQAWNYVQWNSFDPGLFGGVFNASDDTTDGYQYVIPHYVTGLHGASGTNGVTTACPPWQVYFTANASQLSQGQYTVLSVGFASTNGNVTVALNGHSLTWNGNSTLKTSDAATRSGLQGTYQWVVFQWPTGDLNAAGASNEITLSTDGNVEYDALRMEITNTPAAPSVRSWYDYEFVTSGTYIPANDAVDNPASVASLMVPAISTQPVPQTVNAGASPTLSVTATGATGYQWQLNGTNIAGATGPTLTLANIGTAQAGTYTAIATNAYGPATSSPASVTVNVSSYLFNISTRGYVGSGPNQDLDAGFYIEGTGNKNILLRGDGPFLATNSAYAGLTLVSPQLTFNNAGGQLGLNTAWGGSQTLINAFNTVFAPVFAT
ncbi:MAG: polysaccharide lyase family protein, partial [Opitutaceae bacterium]